MMFEEEVLALLCIQGGLRIGGFGGFVPKQFFFFFGSTNSTDAPLTFHILISVHQVSFIGIDPPQTNKDIGIALATIQ